MRIAYLGPRGTFTEEALSRYCQIKHIQGRPVPASTIEAVIDMCMQGEADYAFVPVENSLGGSVLTTMDYLTEHAGIEICGEITMPIRHYLWGVPGATVDEIETIYSHPQALRQCRLFLAEHMSHCRLRETGSTSEAGRIVAASGDRRQAAVGGQAVGSTHSLMRLTERIQDTDVNVTRFIMVRHNEPIMQKPTRPVNKLSLFCELDGLRPGSLYEGLAVFAKRGINLVRIESRPAKGRLGEYKFFFDLDMSTGYDNIAAAIEELCGIASAVQLFGMYESIATK